MDLAETEIQEYSKKGHGIARLSKPVEVIGAVKGDRLLISLLGKGRKKQKAKIEEILTSSESRRVPLCSLSGICGGCSWQSVAYESQLLEKERRVRTLFSDHPTLPIVASESDTSYRGKMEFTFSQDREENQYLGLIGSSGKGRVVNVGRCTIAHPWTEAALESIRAWWKTTNLEAYHPHRDTGSLRTLTLRSSLVTGSKMVILTVSGKAEYALTRQDLESYVGAASLDEKTSVYLLIQKTEKGSPTQFFEMHLGGPAYLEEDLLGMRFRFSPQAFFQPNQKVAEKMFAYLIGALNLTGEEKVLDLCCGVGTIGMLLAKHVRQVIGVEINPASICDAKENIERLGIENMQVYQKDVKSFLEEPSFFTPDIVILDPPRTGLGEKSVELIQNLNAKKIVYISCNPETQKEDIGFFSNYKIISIAPFDQFPNTPHIENIILLTSNSSF